MPGASRDGATDSARTISSEERAAVLALYGVGQAVAGPESGGGTANASEVVRTQSGTYFLKRRNPKYAAPGSVRFDHRLMEHLEPRKVGTPLAILGRGGARWTERNGYVYELYPFRPGAPHDPESLVQIAEAGRALARYQSAARSFRPPPGKEWPRYHDPKGIREGLAEMEADLRRVLPPRDWSYLAAAVEDLEREYPDALYDALPRLVVHGDFHPGNVLYENDRVSGIFDLDWATEQPRVLDVADGLFLFAGARAAGIDATDIVSLTQTWTPSLKRSRTFLEGYLETETIGEEEWRILVSAIRARWIYCRIAGRMKLPSERRTGYVVEGLLEPLRMLGELEQLHP